jgi:signal transduction histidine kinase
MPLSAQPARPDAGRVGAGGPMPAGGEPSTPLERSLGDNDWVSDVWSRGRRLVILCLILAGTLLPARDSGPGRQALLYVLSAVVLLGWAMPVWLLPPVARREEVGLVLYGVAGTVLAVAQPNGAAMALPAIACARAGARVPLRWSVGFAVALSVGYLAGRAPELSGMWSWWVLGVPVLFVGCAVGGRARAQNAALTAQAETERARAAALDERARIAREIHDILAHALAALTVQLETADALLDGGRAAQAQESVRRAGKLAREGLTETRRAIGALRGDSVPLPELLSALVASYESNVEGQVSVRTVGQPRPLEPDAVLALYRTAQEALTNAHKHAPGAPIELVLSYDPGLVRLSVENGAAAGSTGALAATGGGYGLAGLRERAELVGGSLQAGPVGDGYRVGVTIPA